MNYIIGTLIVVVGILFISRGVSMLASLIKMVVVAAAIGTYIYVV